jgi:hypothetical protein
MTVIRPNSVSGINSITAQANEIKIFKSDGTQGGLMIDGANLNATSGISTVAALTVTGNVSVGGTLTYQDVTNIDSVGIVTARAGVKVPDNQKVFLGTDSDLEIYHDGSNARIKNTTGQLWLQSDNGIRFVDSAVNESFARFTDNGAVELYYDGGKKFETTSTGVKIDNSSTTDMLLLNVSGTNFAKIGHNSASGTNILDVRSEGHTRFLTGGNNERIRILSDGKVVIGTDTAASNSELTVRAASPHLSLYATPGNDSRLNMGDTDDHDIGLIAYANSDNSMRFTTNATERLRITSTGQLLLGIDNAVDAEVDFQIHSATSGNGPILNMTNDTGDCRIFFGQDNSSGSANAAGQIRYNVANNYLAFYANLAERARIDSDGHLQIRREGVASMPGVDTRHTRYIVRQTNGQEAILGSVFAQGQSAWGGDLVFATKNNTGSPSSGLTERMRLDMNGKLIIKGESNAELNLRPGSGSGNDIISFENSGGTQRGNITYDTDNNFLFFNVSQSERTRIDQNGTLSHGTTTDNPGDANTNTGFAIRANGKYFFSCASDGGHINRNNAGYVLHARYGGGHKGGVYVNSTNTSFQTSSDYRLKENVVNLDGAITRVKQLTPRRFNFIVEPNDTIDGFIAHEAATVVPEAVTGTYNEVDSNGDPVYQGIDNGKLVPLLTAALQEAIAKIETLEAAVTALQGS